MTATTWLRKSIGEERLRRMSTETRRRRLAKAFGSAADSTDDRELAFVANALELELFDVMEDDDRADDRCAIASETFQIARTVAWPEEPLAAAQWLVRLGCIAVLSDRSADFRRIVMERGLPDLPLDSPNWGIRVWSSVLDVWLRLLRKNGWDDLDTASERIVTLRKDQKAIEPGFLKEAEARRDVRPAWSLMAYYHLAKAAEILGAYFGQGSVDGRFDIREQLQAQFDWAINASARGRLIEQEAMSRLLAWAANMMVDSSIVGARGFSVPRAGEHN